jgi:hypothetical protein
MRASLFEPSYWSTAAYLLSVRPLRVVCVMSPARPDPVRSSSAALQLNISVCRVGTWYFRKLKTSYGGLRAVRLIYVTTHQ